MKMKQLLTLTLAAAMVAGTSLTAGAATTTTTPGFNPAAQEDKDVGFDSEQKSEESTEIPVYGYVGPDALLIDEDPDDENNKPAPITDAEYQINVSVPVKILWAVFESDVDGSGIGTVTSPDYYIRNNSEQLSVSLKADSFAARTGMTATDNTYVDDNWTEDLTITRKQDSLMKRNVALGKTSVTLGNLGPEDQMEFDVQGKLDINKVDAAFSNTGETVMESDFSNYLQPEYDLVLTIKAITP